MAFKKRDDFYEQKSKKTSEVPFLSEMTEDDFEVVVNASWPVIQLYNSPKGLLIVTALFKTFIFRKSTLFDHILSTVENAVKSNVAIDSLSVFVNNNKTVYYGEDDSFLQVWETNKHNFYATLVSVDSEPKKTEDEVPF
jgi:hypothetical protein